MQRLGVAYHIRACQCTDERHTCRGVLVIESETCFSMPQRVDEGRLIQHYAKDNEADMERLKGALRTIRKRHNAACALIMLTDPPEKK